MTPGELIEKLGGAAEVARKLGIGKNTVGNWRIRGFAAWALIDLRALCEKEGVDPGDALDPQPRAKVA